MLNIRLDQYKNGAPHYHVFINGKHLAIVIKCERGWKVMGSSEVFMILEQAILADIAR